MLKVIIADDEPKVNLLLQKIVDWENWGTRSRELPMTGKEHFSLLRKKSRMF